jgi:uncharacterized protein
MEIKVHPSLAEIPAAAWNALRGSENPFLRHEFLHALEATGCVRPQTGWLPSHMAIWDGKRLLAAAPMYVKTHSWGEFVFDWTWAEAYAQQGLAYYPKLIGAVPFSPVPGQRLLTSRHTDSSVLAPVLAKAAREWAAEQQCSSVHWLFTTETDAELLAQQGYALRSGFQFHWHNAHYADFEAFLAALSAKKRKNIRRERRLIAEQGFEFVRLRGDAIERADWESFYRFYVATMRAYGNRPWLNLEFFRRIAEALGEKVLLIQARRHGKVQGAALLLVGEDALYGRYWGSEEEHAGLHFETCYYQGLEFCIEARLARFEPGAQGAHKLARGFLPSPTRSLHWLEDGHMREALRHYLRRERAAVSAQMAYYRSAGPYRATAPE